VVGLLVWRYSGWGCGGGGGVWFVVDNEKGTVKTETPGGGCGAFRRVFCVGGGGLWLRFVGGWG